VVGERAERRALAPRRLPPREVAEGLGERRVVDAAPRAIGERGAGAGVRVADEGGELARVDERLEPVAVGDLDEADAGGRAAFDEGAAVREGDDVVVDAVRDRDRRVAGEAVGEADARRGGGQEDGGPAPRAAREQRHGHRAAEGRAHQHVGAEGGERRGLRRDRALQVAGVHRRGERFEMGRQEEGLGPPGVALQAVDELDAQPLAHGAWSTTPSNL
jgi:hypothetical protein